MDIPCYQRVCHVCGEADFTLHEPFENELVAKCKNCSGSVKYASEKDFTIEEKET